MTHKHSRDPEAMRKRQLVRLVACPYCGAPAGDKCRRVRIGGRPRYASHKERLAAYRGETVILARVFVQRSPSGRVAPSLDDFEVLP